MMIGICDKGFWVGWWGGIRLFCIGRVILIIVCWENWNEKRGNIDMLGKYNN